MKINPRQLISLFILILALIFSVFFVRSFLLPRAKAGTYPIVPSLLNLTPPYIRLAKSSVFPSLQKDTLAVDILVSTASLEILAADVSLEYDSNALELDTSDIRLHDKFRVYSINQNSPGKLDISLFSNPQRGEPTLRTSSLEETSIATLNFRILSTSISQTSINLKFTPQSLEESNLIPVYTNRPEVPQDVIQSVGSLTNVSLK